MVQPGAVAGLAADVAQARRRQRRSPVPPGRMYPVTWQPMQVGSRSRFTFFSDASARACAVVCQNASAAA